MVDPAEEPSNLCETDVAGLQTSSLVELSEARRNVAVGPRWLKAVAEWSRTAARGSALAAFVVDGIGFACYPRPWNRAWCLDYLSCVMVSNAGGFVAVLSIFCCIFAAILVASSSTSSSRPLWPAVGFIVASVVLNLLTPRIR